MICDNEDMILYNWQKECLEKWDKNNRRGIVNVFTGGGKTILALAAAAKLRDEYKDNLHIRIVVPTIALAKQWKKELISFFPEMEFERNAIGFYYGTLKNSPDREVTIYVINSARETLPSHIVNDMKNGIHSLLICDECHRFTGEVNRNVFRFLHSSSFDSSLYHCLGLSATPQNRNFNTVLVPALGNEIFRYDIRKAHEDGKVIPFVLVHTAISLSGSEAKEYGELSEKLRILYGRLLKEYPFLKYLESNEFYQEISRISAEEDGEGICTAFLNMILKRKSLVYNAENRKNCVLSLLQNIHADEKVILFAERIEQADEIYHQLLPLYGNLVTHYHSEMPAKLRAHNLSLFRIGEARILISCKALDEGLDVPDASIGIVMSCTSVSRQRIQRLGRILRRNPEKDMAVLYYIHANGTSEDEIYLDDISDFTDEFRLFYDGNDNQFFSDDYSACAVKMMRSLPSSITSEEKKEIGICFEEGIMRADWFLPADILSEKIKAASERHEKNYWIVMKRMSAAKTDTKAEMTDISDNLNR